MRYSYNSKNHCHISVPSDSRLELRIYQKNAQGRIPQNYGLPAPSCRINAKKLSSCGYEPRS